MKTSFLTPASEPLESGSIQDHAWRSVGHPKGFPSLGDTVTRFPEAPSGKTWNTGC